MTDSFRTSRTVSALDPAEPHLVLVGLPGSGKSTVGALLAERLHRTFLDFDTEIERREGATVSAIFAERGEQAFRALELKLTEELRELGNMVLAPGGGWVANAGAVALLKPPARLIYLRVRPETALKRLGTAAGGRPLLSRPDAPAEMQKLFEERRALYQSADIEIGAELVDPQQVTEEILRKIAAPATPH
jgi:shikimate kinase